MSDPDDATYKANFVAGPLISVGDIKFAAGAKFNSGGPGQNSVLIDLRSFETLFGDLGCFDNDSFTAGEGDDEGDIATGPFGIQVKRNNPNSAVVGFWFFAQGTDGSTVSYVVHVPGTMPSWPPTIGNSVPITGDGTYEMGHNNGPGNGVACKGTGSVDYSLLVTRIT